MTTAGTTASASLMGSASRSNNRKRSTNTANCRRQLAAASDCRLEESKVLECLPGDSSSSIDCYDCLDSQLDDDDLDCADWEEHYCELPNFCDCDDIGKSCSRVVQKWIECRHEDCSFDC